MSDTIKILGVVDGSDFLESATSLLRDQKDFHVVTATSRDKGLKILENGKTDCVVSEYGVLGDESGFLNEIKDRYPDLPVILFKGEKDKGVASLVIPMGVTGETWRETDDPKELVGLIRSSVSEYRSKERNAANENIRDVFERISDGFVGFDSDLRYTYVNSRAEELLGRSAEDLLGKKLTEAFPESVQSRFYKEFQEAMETQEPVSLEEFYEPLNTWFEIRAYPSETGLSIYFRDITEEKEHERKIELLHDATQALIRAKTERGMAETAVNTACDILDIPLTSVLLYDEEDNVLRPVAYTQGVEEIMDEIHPLEEGEGIFWRVFSKGEIEVHDDVRKDEDVYDPDTSVRSQIVYPLGEHGILACNSTDIERFDDEDVNLGKILAANLEASLDGLERERKLREREKQLMEERDRFAALFENIPDPAVAVMDEDDDPVIQDVNEAFEDVFGYDSEEAVGKSVDDLIVPPGSEEGAQEINSRIFEGESLRAEVQRQTVGGIKDFLLHAVPRPNGVGSYGIYTDITERKKRERRLEVLNRVIRHDLRNTMNVIMGDAEILLSRISDPSDRHRLEEIREKAKQMADASDKARQIHDLLKKEETTQSHIEIVEAIEGRIEMVRKNNPRVGIQVDLPESEWVYASEIIGSAIDNVIENAIEHNDKPDPKIWISVSETQIDGDEYVDIEVADNGPGIPDEEIEVLEEKRETELKHISGIGLWLINWIVNESDGHLIFKENEPEGSVVTIRLRKGRSPSA